MEVVVRSVRLNVALLAWLVGKKIQIHPVGI